MTMVETSHQMNHTLKLKREEGRNGKGLIEIAPLLKNLRLTESNEHSQKNHFAFSEVHQMYQTYPFGFRTPENCSITPCRWIYPITFGGGLVGGDQIDVDFTIGERCCAVICTQEVQKVYHCLHSEETTQTMSFKLKPSCLLCVLPDPLVCYRDAKFFQKQTFHMSSSSNLVLLDWLLAGRKALGEFWDFQRYCSKIEIYIDDKLVLRECNDLENTKQVTLDSCMKKFEFMGTLIVLGPYVSEVARKLEEKYSRKKEFGERMSASLVVSVSPLSFLVGGKLHTGCYLRFLASSLKQASKVISDITTPLLDDLGADPFERKL